MMIYDILNYYNNGKTYLTRNDGYLMVPIGIRDHLWYTLWYNFLRFHYIRSTGSNKGNLYNRFNYINTRT